MIGLVSCSHLHGQYLGHRCRDRYHRGGCCCYGDIVRATTATNTSSSAKWIRGQATIYASRGCRSTLTLLTVVSAWVGLLPVVFATSLPRAGAAQSLGTDLADSVASAYLDEVAARLIPGAKNARNTAQLAIDSYTALVRERIAFEMPSLRRRGPLVNGEYAFRVRWSRDEPTVVRTLGSRVQFLGSPREARPDPFPLLTAGLTADPLRDPFALGLYGHFGAQQAQSLALTPLDPDSDRYYEYRSGDTITVGLYGGRSIPGGGGDGDSALSQRPAGRRGPLDRAPVLRVGTSGVRAD